MPRPVRRRAGVRPQPERLDDRVLLTMVNLTGVTATDWRTLAINYTVEPGTNLSGLPLGIFRSADPVLDDSDVKIGSAGLTASQLTPGTYANVPIVLGVRGQPFDPLTPDPAHPYIFVTATLADGQTSAFFRKYVIGLVSHGFEPPTGDNQTPAWVTAMAGSLQAEGYDVAIPFNWMATAGLPEPNQATNAGARAAQQVIQAIQNTVPADAVADIHLIGHSRGSVVITTAMQTIQDSLSSIPQAAGGYWRMSYLDPHPSHAANVVPFSAADSDLGSTALALANAFQDAAQDPFPLTIPSMVANAQIYYENSPAATLQFLSEESVLNPWGTFPPGIAPATGAGTSVDVLDLTTPGMSHSAVYQWFQQNVIPTFATASPFVTGPVDAPIFATGQNLHAIEDAPAPHLAAVFTDPNPLASSSDFTATIDWGDGTQSAGTIIGTPTIGYTVTGIHTYSSSGTLTNKVTIVSKNGSTAVVSGSVTVAGWSTTVADVPPGGAPLVVGTRSDTGATVFQFLAYDPNFTGGVRVATADVNGDGTPDIITAPGRGTAGIVKIFDGQDQRLLGQFAPFGPRFRGGITISAGDVDADGHAEIIAAAGPGLVKVFRADGSLVARLRAQGARFSARRNATTLTSTDLDSDGRSDLLLNNPNGSTRPVFTGRALAEAELNRRIRLLRNAPLRKIIAQSSFAGALPLIRRLLRGR
jgi:hypothetical protein